VLRLLDLIWKPHNELHANPHNEINILCWSLPNALSRLSVCRAAQTSEKEDPDQQQQNQQHDQQQQQHEVQQQHVDQLVDLQQLGECDRTITREGGRLRSVLTKKIS